MALTEKLRAILGRRMAYRRALPLDSGDVRIVLADLRRFCGGDRPSYRVSPVTRQVDPYAMAVAEGRREVWLRIQTFLHINDADLLRLQEAEETRHAE
jgi:hypothetical protein